MLRFAPLRYARNFFNSLRCYLYIRPLAFLLLLQECNYITLPTYKGIKFHFKFQLFEKKFAKSKKGSTFAPGKMAEWSNAAVLKTVDLHGSGGSNPSLSATKSSRNTALFCFCWYGLQHCRLFYVWWHSLVNKFTGVAIKYKTTQSVVVSTKTEKRIANFV